MAFWVPKSQSLFLTRFPVLLFFIPLWSQSVKYFKYGADRAQAASTSHCSLLISSGFSKIPVSWFSNMVVAEMTKEDLHARSVFHVLSSLKSTFNELHFYICATFLSSAEDYSNVIHAVTWILHIMWVLFWRGAVLMGFHTFNLGPKIPYITQTVQCRDTFMNREILKMFFKKFTGNNTGLNVAMIWECIIFLKKLCNKSQH